MTMRSGTRRAFNCRAVRPEVAFPLEPPNIMSLHQTASQRGYLTPMNNFSVVARSYNISHLDAAIAHLEQVLNLEGANSLFSKTYWHGRVLEALSTRVLRSRSKCVCNVCSIASRGPERTRASVSHSP